jgi:putative addiction module killer protein
VEAAPKEIRLYETEYGRVPFAEWMDSIEGQPVYGAVMARLDRLEQGNFGNHHSVGEGVSELVLDIGPGYRVYFGRDGESLVILLVGGSKKSQQSDIETAKRYWRKYNA